MVVHEMYCNALRSRAQVQGARYSKIIKQEDSQDSGSRVSISAMQARDRSLSLFIIEAKGRVQGNFRRDLGRSESV
jgi:hypothetical protein